MAGSRPKAVALGDMNGDGKADLAVANLNGNVSVLLNKGDGRFNAASNYAVGKLPVLVAIGDLDGDGNADLAVANNDTADVSVLRNKGGGSGMFSAAESYPTGAGPYSVALGDLNGDGRADVVVANNLSDDVSVLLNQGGKFAPALRFPAGVAPYSVVLADLNGDGLRDLAVAGYSGCTMLFNTSR